MLHLALFASMVSALALGIGVFVTNPRRVVNQHFLTLSTSLAAWLGCMAMGFNAATAAGGEFWIRQCSSVAAVIPLSYNLLALAILHPRESWFHIVRRLTPLMLVTLAMVLLCRTHLFLVSAFMPPGETAVAEPVYGPGFLLFVVYFIGALSLMIYRLASGARRAVGMQRTEMQYVLLGSAVSLGAGVFASLIVPLITGSSQSIRLAFLSTLIMQAVIAYGIATHTIFSVAYVLRRGLAYGLLLAYLSIVYLSVWRLADVVLSACFGNLEPLPHLAAALVTALTMAPANGWWQRFVNTLMWRFQSLEVTAAAQRASEVLRSVATLPKLLGEFSSIVMGAVATDRAVILLRQEDRFAQRYPPANDEQVAIPADDFLARELQRHGAVVREEWARRRRTTASRQLLASLAQWDAAAAFGISHRSQLMGIVLLGERAAGRIYSQHEQTALKSLCDQLGIAVENAQLYTETQDRRIYNEILLANLTSGVIAIDCSGEVTVFNTEAEEIVGMPVTEVLRQRFERLPKPVAAAIEETMHSGEGVRDREHELAREDGSSIPIRLSTATFARQSGETLGVLVVLNNLSALRRLEMEVRRNERLASLGTLAAGMAHEIKNPMVSIKTFSQLLPKRYDDPDFRSDFSELMGQEIQRIDTIVNALLNFARPIDPSFRHMHVQETLEQALRLLKPRLESHGIALKRSFLATNDLVVADADQLQQVFMNLLLNAVEAMETGGELSVTTHNGQVDAGPDGAPAGPLLQVCICDTGCGMPTEDQTRIFDPFFTTKSQGTGLGLPVVHRIISRHSGTVEVESSPGVGTTFCVSLRLADGGGEASL